MDKEYDLNLPLRGKKKALNPGQLLSAETILRLNPHWIVEDFGGEGEQLTADLRDHETGQPFQLTGSLSSDGPDSLVLTLSHDTFNEIRLFTRSEGFWARVTYGSGQEQPAEDIERHVVLWIRSIKEYLRMYLNNTPNAVVFRYIMNRITLKMTPSQRKISLMLIRITIVELFVILLIVIGYVIFVLKP